MFTPAIAIFCEVVATSFVKLSDGFSKPIPSIVTVVGYAASFYFLSISLREIPTGVAYAIWSGVGIVLVTAFAWVFQDEKLDMAALYGLWAYRRRRGCYQSVLEQQGALKRRQEADAGHHGRDHHQAMSAVWQWIASLRSQSR